MEVVPTAELTKQRMGPFRVEADEVTGFCGIQGVDFMVFTYKSAVAAEQRFTESLANALAKSGWRRQTNTAEDFDIRREFAKRETGPT